VRSDRILRALGILCLLSLGMLFGHLFRRSDQATALGFGEGLWLARRADLIVQLGLMFVGALGIRALLPGEGEEDETGE